MANSPPASRAPIHFVVPGRIDLRTGGYEYDRRIVSGLGEVGWTVNVVEIPGAFPFPSAAERAALARALARLRDEAIVVVDGLAFGAAPDEVERESARLRFVVIVHHPLARETGLTPGAAAALEASERRALGAACAVVVTSPATVESLRPYAVSPHRVRIVEPGTDPAPIARGSTDGLVHLLAVGSIVARKGFDVLIDGLAAIPERNWRLACVGSVERDAAAVERLRDRIRAGGLQPFVRLEGEAGAGALARYYDAADVFVLATWHEGYGMAIAEALARGLPIVSTPTGGIADLVGDEAGLLVAPGERAAWAAALSRVAGDADLRARLRAGARRVRDRLPAWPAAAGRFSQVLEDVIDGRF